MKFSETIYVTRTMTRTLGNPKRHRRAEVIVHGILKFVKLNDAYLVWKALEKVNVMRLGATRDGK